MPARRPAALRRAAVAIALPAILAGTALAGCGSDDGDPVAIERPAETAEALPELPRGWEVHRNRNAGFVIGVPPGWTARARGVRSELRSPDRLVAVSVTADRTRAALEAPLTEYAQATISALPGVRELEPGEPRPYEHRYDAVAIAATGVAGPDDLDQRFRVIVLRREDIAALPVLVARNAEQKTARWNGEIHRMLQSLRSRPLVPPSIATS